MGRLPLDRDLWRSRSDAASANQTASSMKPTCDASLRHLACHHPAWSPEPCDPIIPDRQTTSLTQGDLSKRKHASLAAHRKKGRTDR